MTIQSSSRALSTTSLSTSLPAPRVLRLAELMYEDRGWTRSHATCSFDDVPRAAPGWLDYGALRLAVLQDIDPGHGYPRHPHHEIETITIMLRGQLAHEDTVTGNDITGPDDVAVVSAGSGLEHAEMVHGAEPARAVMFWLRSSPAGLPPRFARRQFTRDDRRDRLVALASGRGHAVALAVRCDATIYGAVLTRGRDVSHAIEPCRRIYALASDAAIEVNGVRAEAGERVLCDGPGRLDVRATGDTELFIVDLPA